MAKQTYSKEERKAQFLKTGVALAKKDGVDSVTAAAVAAKHEVTAPLVFHIFGSRDKLRAAIKREAKKQGVTLAEPKPKKVAKAAAPKVAKAPTRKRSVAEVKAIKDKAAGKRPVRAAGAKASASAVSGTSRAASAKASASATGKRKVSRSAKDGKFVDKATVKANPDTTVTQKVRAPRKKPAQKYPTQPVPAISMVDGEPKATI